LDDRSVIRNAHIVLLLGATPTRLFLEALLDTIAEANREWYLEQWGLGRDPPRSARDAGVTWQPDRPDTRAIFQDAPTVFAQRFASCGPIAAITVGHDRARDQMDGWGLEAARARRRVVLRPQGRDSWHAFVQTDKGLDDPTRGMKR
jgi:hypothetical protein